MRVFLALVVVIIGYALLLASPGMITLKFSLYLVLALIWLAASLLAVWRVPSRGFKVIMSVTIGLAFVSWPINAMFVGCYAFNDCP
ncbi:hypothetical protein [Novosphingobium sp. PASSN1]|uniref:hypothetical protein n=1 Tax=Novosphingobium sp. PASSN1 TaxID=2015561 RepID=UPI000BC73DAE|nr:hypothetical protein [Novosphingobium sp. PASSN1]OYU36960.1 MAG: hypothetical protein CFE35_00785 [Novosphingobium sp. PASSN1]